MDGYDRELLVWKLRRDDQMDQFLARVGEILDGDEELDVESAWEIISAEFGGPPAVSELGSDTEDVLWSALSMAAMKRSAAPRDEAKWVIQHHAVPLERIDPDLVPSSGSVTMLRWAREVGLTDFMKTIYAKLMPSKSELEQDARFRQSGRVLQETLAEVIKAHEDATVQAELKREMMSERVQELIEKRIQEKLDSQEVGDPI